MSRSTRYEDPLDAIWLECASRLGLRVQRSGDTYASSTGQGDLLLGDGASLDPDDCIAQMVLHEICHWLVCGPESLDWVDWGLDNEVDRDVELEHATLRVQAALLEPLGLRDVFAPTTVYREFYDALPPDPFFERSVDERSCIVRARAGYARRLERPWDPTFAEALGATADIVHSLRRFRSIGPATDLLARAREPRGLHRTGIPLRSPDAEGAYRCGDCAWQKGDPKGLLRCVQAKGARVQADDPACERFETTFDCQACGACCREAYGAVDVSAKDPAVLLAPDWLVRRGRRYDIRRDEHRCAALRGGQPLPRHRPAIAGPQGESEQVSPPFFIPSDEPFSCAIYEVRPQTCRDFTRGSTHCLTARRRVGLSR